MKDSEHKESSTEDQVLPPEPKELRWYALYQVIKKPNSSHGCTNADDEDESNNSNGTSLSILASNLSGTDEISLRIYITKRIDKGAASQNDEGIVISGVAFGDAENVESKFSVYYSTLAPDWLKIKTNSTDLDTKGFVVCFASSVPQELDLFKPDLDAYSNCLKMLLDENLDGLGTTVTSYLEDWVESCINYTIRAINILGHNLKYILHGALVQTQYELKGLPPNLVDDLRKLQQTCKIEVFNKSSTQSTFTKGFSINFVQDDGTKVECDYGIPFFCQYWTSEILSCCEDEKKLGKSVAIRNIIEEFKLKIIQDVNCIKRLIQKANEDYYSLFKAFTFLKHTGNVSVLLHILKDEENHNDASATSTKSIIAMMEEFFDT